MLAASLGSWAQTAPTASQGGTLPAVTVKDRAEVPQAKNKLRVTNSNVGKGNQELRDIPQSLTVITERLIDDRNLDDFREVLRSTAGVTFQAGETGEEDVRLRGFSLGQAGDIYTDGLRDGTLYERDTFNNDRIEILKGSASMLLGKGSTGGIVNQVSKQPFLMNQNEVTYTLGTGQEHRLTGDFNIHTGESAAFRINAVVHNAENYGARQRKLGLAPTYRWGIGTRDEFSVGLYQLEVNGRPLYNHPWVSVNDRIVPVLPARNYYGLASDHMDTSARNATLSHVHRLDHDAEVRTQLRHGRFERDLWASVIRLDTLAPITDPGRVNGATLLSRSPKGRIGISDTTQATSDYSGKFKWGGRQHHLMAGVDLYQEDGRRANNFTGAPPGPPVPGAPPIRPGTSVGSPDDGAFVNDARRAPPFNTFDARNIGLYAQDMVSITPTVKLLAGLRFDRFNASYTDVAGISNSRGDNLWSPRLGALYQPDAVSSYYASFGTSYNTTGDTYQFTPGAPSSRAINTPPEKSRNFEVGAKWELSDKRASLGVAAFYSEKYNERNTDPDTAAMQELLSGKRHAAGMEFNLAGRFNPKWEVFFNHTWVPQAKIDESNVTAPPPPSNPKGGAQRKGDRPGLTPKHSGSLWTTYRLTPQLRVGGGLNYRGEQQPEGSRNMTADSFVTADLMAEYTFSQTWSLKLNVTNITDKLYADSLYRGFHVPGAPRAVQVTAKAMF
nr:TonB-dependent siderophore receptor [Ramlibacter sp.]